MQKDSVATLSKLAARTYGVFRGVDAVGAGVSRRRLVTLRQSGTIERVFPDTYRMTVVAPSHEQSLRAALMWAGSRAAGAGRSAGYVYRLEGVQPDIPEIEVSPKAGARHDGVILHRTKNRASLRTRSLTAAFESRASNRR